MSIDCTFTNFSKLLVKMPYRMIIACKKSLECNNSGFIASKITYNVRLSTATSRSTES